MGGLGGRLVGDTSRADYRVIAQPTRRASIKSCAIGRSRAASMFSQMVPGWGALHKLRAMSL
jgi:hypothetical protein